MDTWVGRIGLGLGAIALVLVVVQQGTIGELETKLDKALKAQPAVATDDDTVAETYDDAALSARVAALERGLSENREMRRAVARASSSGRPRAVVPSPTGTTKTGEVADEVSSLREDVDALLTGAGVQSDEGKKEIANLVKRVQQQERTARMARWTEFRKKADVEFIGKFAEEEGLDSDQVRVVTDVMGGLREAQMKVRSQMRDGTLSFEEGRAKRKAIRDDANKALGEAMSAEQVESFTKKMQEQRRGRRGGR